jgi:hypothetical protein
MRVFQLVALIMLGFTAFSQGEVDCKKSFDFIYSKWDNVQNMQYHSKKFERHLDQDNHAEFDFTVQRKPFKVAGRMAEKGHYILYDPEVSAKEAMYISNGFPFTNLTLDIQGKLFRGMNHYTISDAGCEFILGIIRKEYERIPENFKCSKVVRNGNEEILIRAETDQFGWKDYKASAGETVLSIANKLSVSAYLIIEKNDDIHAYTDECSGKTIKVPSHYGRVVELYIDAEHGLPTRIANYDDKDLFESFDYTNYKFNVKLAPDYFTVDYLDSLN